jgi:ATP/maltotriose-dependent transcriptional regulator MalT
MSLLRSWNIDRQHTLLTTKLFLPRLRRQTILRHRLFARLDTLLGRRLALICAPAGYGKTTLLSSWVERWQSEKVVWLSIDREDNEPLNFWRYLLSALEVSDLSVLPSQAEQDRVIRLILTRLLNEVAERAGHVLVLLDDYHLIHNEEIHAELSFLLEHLPPNMHLALTTRSEPPLPLARLRLGEQLVELRVEDLRFTHAEVNEFMQREHGASLEERDIELLERWSEGWIAGLHLALLSLDGRAEVSTFLHAFKGSPRPLFDYLVEEVLQTLPGEEQTFLLRTSILSRLCPGACNALTGRDDAQEILTRLARANLFLAPLDEQGYWYRYHHLFAEALFQRLRQLDAASVPYLHKQASLWYEQNGLIEEAFEHALAISDFARASYLFGLVGQQMLLRGEMRTLRSWLERLPTSLVRSNPYLSLTLFWTLVDGQHLPEAAQCLSDVQSSLNGAETIDQNEFTIVFNSAKSTYERHRKDFTQAITLIQRALELTPPTDYRQRCYMLLHLAEYYWSSCQLVQAQQALRESLQASEAGGYAFFLAINRLYSARMQELEGRLKRAQNSYEHTLSLVTESACHTFSLVGDAHLGLARLAYERNDLPLARQHQRESERFSQRSADGRTLFYAALLLARLKLSQNDLAGTRAALPDFEPGPGDFDFFFPYDNGIECYTRIQLALGEFEDAAFILDQLAELRLPPLLREDFQLARARLSLARKQAAGVAGSLQPLVSNARAQGRKTSAIRLLLVQALAWQAQNELARARTLLAQALSLAEPAGFTRLFVDEGPSFYSLLHSLRETPTVSQDYLTRLLAAFPPEARGEDRGENVPETATFALCDPLSARELEILYLIAAGCSNQEIATRLVIALSTLKTHINRMYAKLQVSSRTQALLRARSLRLL